MGAMYRLKAYFGMVPAEEMDEYADDELYGDPRRGPRDPADGRWDDRWPGRRVRSEEPSRPEGERGYSYDRYPDDYDEPTEERYAGWDRRAARVAAVDGPREAGRPAAPGPSGVVTGIGAPPVRGALAVDPDAHREPPLREPARLPERVPAPAVPEQRERGAAALSTITTLQPRSYNEARTIGERYRDGVPVIMNLTELDDAAAKRLVDFAAGLAFALRGSIDKVTSRVFLLTPADVEVSADDARKLAERGILRQD
jgi:cell division inhibitor SepF